MEIGILSVKSKNDTVNFTDILRKKAEDIGYSVKFCDSVALNPLKIKAALDSIIKNGEKPETVIVTQALSSTDSSSFKKYFAGVVAAAEHAENTPTPKHYWKKRNAAFNTAKKNGASPEELEELKKQFEIFRKKSKVFSLDDMGNGYKGYCFVYKGIKVAVLPKAELAGLDVGNILTLALIRTKEVFENSAEDYPGGFSTYEYVPPKTGFVNRYIPIKGDSGSEIVRKSVVIASFCVFMVALSLLLYNMLFLSMQNAQLNGEIQKLAHGTEVSTGTGGGKPDVGDKIDWKKLKAINKEIVGWIQIDNTKIDYPVLWHKADSRTSQYYLTHNYKNDYDSWGSIFLDYRCTKGTDSKNTVIHGHHMNDGTMFGNLLKYGGTTGDLGFYKKSPVVTFNTPSGDAKYKIISVFKTNTLSSQGEFFNYMIGNFQNEKDFMNYVYNVRVRSLFNCPVDTNEDDELITLSTCSYEFTNFRTVVVARKVRKGESAKVDVSKASLNNNAVWPEVYYSSNGGTRPTVTDFCTAYDKKQIDWYNGDYDFKTEKVTKPQETTAPSKSNNSSTVQKQTQAPTQAKVYLTVKFINYDGSTLSTQKVEYGKAAKAPANPVKPSDSNYDYVFKGWQLDYGKVVCDMSIAPKFEAVAKSNNSAGG